MSEDTILLTREKAESLPGDINYWFSWKANGEDLAEYISDYSDLYYGDIKPTRVWNCDLPLYIPSYCSGSDYSGSLVEKSNHDIIIEEYGDISGVHDVYGGHGTFAIALELDKEYPYDLIEKIQGLEDYPLLCEETHSECEMEAQNEAWENWYRQDFIQAIEYMHDICLDNVSQEDIDSAFYQMCDQANEYWVNETGDSMYINLERVCKVSDKDKWIKNGAYNNE